MISKYFNELCLMADTMNQWAFLALMMLLSMIFVCSIVLVVKLYKLADNVRDTVKLPILWSLVGLILLPWPTNLWIGVAVVMWLSIYNAIDVMYKGITNDIDHIRVMCRNRNDRIRERLRAIEQGTEEASESLALISIGKKVTIKRKKRATQETHPSGSNRK